MHFEAQKRLTFLHSCSVLNLPHVIRRINLNQYRKYAFSLAIVAL